MKTAPLFLGALAFFLLASCAGTPDPLGEDIREILEVDKSSAEDWEDSLERAYDPKVILRRAESLYSRQSYIEAEAEYRHFLELHPLHQWADYAQLKLALSNSRQFTTIDRDPGPVRKALVEFQKVLTVYPGSKYIEEARKGIEENRERLGRHEFYVGHFYFRTKAYPAAIRRLEGFLEEYPGHPKEADTLFFLGRSYAADGKTDRASERLNQLVQNFPESEYREKARQILSGLPASSED